MQHQRRLLLNAGFNQWPLILAKSRINDQGLLRDSNSSKSWRVADVSKFVSGRRLVCSAAVGTLLLPCRARLVKASNIFPRAGRAKPLLMGYSCRSPFASIPMQHRRKLTNASQPYCSPWVRLQTVSPLQRWWLKKLASGSCLKHPQTMCQEDSFLLLA